MMLYHYRSGRHSWLHPRMSSQCPGLPAILKGFLYRVLLRGVSFTLSDGKVRPAVTHIRHPAVVVTCGRSRAMALWMGDPQRRIVKGSPWWLTGKQATRTDLARYHTNVMTEAQCKRFIVRVDDRMGLVGPMSSGGADLMRRNLDADAATGLNRAPWMAGVAQLVERQVVVLDAVGSSPIARPIRSACT